MAKMEKRAYAPHLAVIGLMALTSLALALAVDVRVSDQAGVRAVLPDHVGDWTGVELRYCQEATCQKEFRRSDLADPDTCPACGGRLATMSFIEARLLPADTVLLKKRYTNNEGRVLFASVVISGRERASIHRPEVCLAGQGTDIANQSVITVPMEGRAPLRVKVLDLVHSRLAPDGTRGYALSYYAYWFVGHGRETPEHWQRMWWMAADRVFRNVSHRWAYISVSGGRAEEGDGHLEQARAFIHLLYPQMIADDPPGRPA